MSTTNNEPMEQTIRELQKTRPFQPIEIELASGETLMVTRPETMLVDSETLYILEPGEKLARWISMPSIRQVHQLKRG